MGRIVQSLPPSSTTTVSAHPNLEMIEGLLKQGIFGKELDERIRHDVSDFLSIGAGAEMLSLASNCLT